MSGERVWKPIIAWDVVLLDGKTITITDQNDINEDDIGVLVTVGDGASIRFPWHQIKKVERRTS